MIKVQEKPLINLNKLFNLKKSIEEIFPIFRDFPEPVLITDDKERIVYANLKLESLTGSKLNEKFYKPNILKKEEDLNRVHKMILENIGNKQTVLSRVTNDKKGRAGYKIRSEVFPVKASGGSKFYVEIIQGIAQKNSQEDIQKMFFNLVRMSNDPILTVDKKLKITSWNEAAEKLYGFKPDEILGKNLSVLVPKNKLGELKQIYRDINTKFVNFETERITKDGHIRTVSITVSPLTDEFSNLAGFSVIHRDITSQKHLDELKKEFLSLAAHELKTPITTLKLISQAHIAKFKRYGSDQIKLDELELIDRELERLTQLINDILDDSRIDNGKLYLNFEQTNLKKLISNVVKKMGYLTKKHKIVFIKPREKIIVFADQQRIEQVLVNLISNAIKYSKESTIIEIGTEIENRRALIWVKDEGVGIPKLLQRKIFDRYYQVKEKEGRGFGIGLYITKQIVKLHKSKIWVDSRENAGSKFYFTLPLF